MNTRNILIFLAAAAVVGFILDQSRKMAAATQAIDDDLTLIQFSDIPRRRGAV